jgi:hypothetical protein
MDNTARLTCEHGNNISIYTKGEEFLEHMSFSRLGMFLGVTSLINSKE